MNIVIKMVEKGGQVTELAIKLTGYKILLAFDGRLICREPGSKSADHIYEYLYYTWLLGSGLGGLGPNQWSMKLTWPAEQRGWAWPKLLAISFFNLGSGKYLRRWLLNPCRDVRPVESPFSNVGATWSELANEKNLDDTWHLIRWR